MQYEDYDSNPLSGLDWSPTWHPVSVFHRTTSPPPSLAPCPWPVYSNIQIYWRKFAPFFHPHLGRK